MARKNSFRLVRHDFVVGVAPIFVDFYVTFAAV